MAEPIDPALARKLDAFSAPGLPSGFADRVLAAAMAEPGHPAGPALPPLPRARQSKPRRWLRAGSLGLGAIAAGMISISAAATGYFGEPIRRAIHEAPVIGRVAERIAPERPRHRPKLVREPRREAKAAVAAAPAASPSPEAEALPAGPRAWRRRAIMADPEARRAWREAHPIAAQRLDERRAMRRALREEWRRRRIEAGIAPRVDRPQLAPLPQQGEMRPWRLERRERIRQWRERRRQMLEQQAAPEPSPEPTQP